MDEEEVARKRAAIVVGEPLDAISVEELHERIGLLEAEINRIRAAIDGKQGAMNAADALFK